MRYRTKRYLIVLLSLAACVTAYLLFPTIGSERPQTVTQEGVLAEGAQVVYRTTYLICGSVVETTQPAWPELIGQPAEVVLDRHPGWRLVSFQPGRVELAREVEAMCPDMVANRFITTADGRVIVYYGKDRQHLLLKEIAPVSVQDLLPEDLARLEKGVVLSGDEEVSRFLEGLTD